jgi:mRNA-degrading endonuclease toxin of MazEF toxin-antitoxin module
MARYHHGQIVYVKVTGHDGKPKDRTVLIISDDRECARGDPLLVLGITSKLKPARPYYHLLVHDSDTFDPRTGLDRPSWVLCNFWDEVDQDTIRRPVGTLPDEILKDVLDVFDRIWADEDFPDWPPKA